MSNWTIERELTEITGEQTIPMALTKLRVTTDSRLFLSIVVDEDWHRSGAETYCFSFTVRTTEADIPLVLKACVAYAPNTSAVAILDTWIERRRLLAANGINTPRLYSCAKACVLEERIPFSLVDVLIRASGEVKDLLLDRLAMYAGVLSRAGFIGIDAFHDLRSRGDDVVAIDFGEDLGPPQMSADRSADRLKEALEFLERNHVPHADAQRARMYQVFQQEESRHRS